MFAQDLQAIEGPSFRANDTEAVHSLSTNLINRTVLGHVKDGRAFMGTLICLDPQRNLILSDTEELRAAPLANADDLTQVAPSESYALQRRWVGMVMLPGKKLTKLEVAVEPASPPHTDGTSHQPASAAPTERPALHRPYPDFGWPTDPNAYL